MDLPTTALTVAYDGAPFAGFARQPGQVTVQGSLEEALRTVLRRDVEIVGAGRTDAGVHALGQVVSFDSAFGDEPDLYVLGRSVNALAGPSIAVTDVRSARPGFSARFDAISREYRYRIVPGAVTPVFLRHVSWRVKGDLDLAAMRRGAAALIGEHDFRSFCVAESAEGRKTVRALDSVVVDRATELGEECVMVTVTGNAFLHSMVRVIVGTLVDVGTGRRPPEWVADVLAARDRSAAGQTAPPQGLTLWRVDYPDEVWLLSDASRST